MWSSIWQLLLVVFWLDWYRIKYRNKLKQRDASVIIVSVETKDILICMIIHSPSSSRIRWLFTCKKKSIKPSFISLIFHNQRWFWKIFIVIVFIFFQPEKIIIDSFVVNPCNETFQIHLNGWRKPPLVLRIS